MAAPAPVDGLVELLLSSGAITTAEVEAAFRAVARHLFVPGAGVERAYRDEAIPTKLLDGRAVSSASQPSIVAVMLEQLGVEAHLAAAGVEGVEALCGDGGFGYAAEAPTTASW